MSLGILSQGHNQLVQEVQSGMAQSEVEYSDTQEGTGMGHMLPVVIYSCI